MQIVNSNFIIISVTGKNHLNQFTELFFRGFLPGSFVPLFVYWKMIRQTDSFGVCSGFFF